MVVSPPHLPPPSCRIDTHHRLQNLKWIVFIFAAAFLSGVSAALVTVAWIVPVTEQPVSYFFGIHGKNESNPAVELDSSVMRAIEQRTLNIVSKDKIINGFVASDAVALRAAIISSDGWAVAYFPTGKFDIKKWQAVDTQGSIYLIDKAEKDAVSGLLYLKVDGQGFRINAFVNWDNIPDNLDVWAMGRRFELVHANLTDASGDTEINAWSPRFLHKLDSVLPAGALLFGDNGDLIGIAKEDNTVIPPWLVEKQVGAFMGNGKAMYEILPWEGFLVNGVSADGRVVGLSGFYITDVGDKSFKSLVKSGDVLLRINGQAITPELLAKQIIFAPTELTVTLLRDGKEIDVSIKKISLTK